MSAGSGFEYLMRHTARGDGAETSASASVSAMTRYYTEAGYPAGRWLGSGLAGLGNGAGIAPGSAVTVEQMERLFGRGADPITDVSLGRPYVVSVPVGKRIEAQVARLPADMPPDARAAQVAAITAREQARGSRASVAGFDLTFSVPKSVSVLWALSDANVQRAIVDAHHSAVASTIGLIERDVARTRIGAGGAARVPVHGLIAAGFDHHDSRAGDPQLHTHVTIANRVQAATDGKWRTLDSKSIFAASVAHSDTYDLLLADNLTRALGLAWETRLRGRARNPRRELAAVPDALISEFSQRTAAITAAKDAAIDAFIEKHRRQPSGPETVRIRQQATLDTREAKKLSTLAEYAADWTRRADLVLGGDSRAWARQHTALSADGIPNILVSAAMVDDATVEVLAAAVLDHVEAKRSTWTRWNIVAATCRTMAAAGMQFTTEADLLEVRNRVARAVMERSVLLNPTDSPTPVDEVDVTTGRSVFDDPEVFTSLEVLATEDRLLAATGDTTAPTVAGPTVDEIVTAPLAGRSRGLDADQAEAVRRICASGRMCDVLVGPAGTGKTTTMAGLRAAWEAGHGPGSVLGLATSAVAAEVLGTEIDIAAENTAQWLAQQQLQPARAERIAALETARNEAAATGRSTARIEAVLATARAGYDRWALHSGQLLVVDEAGMADLPTISALAAQAKTAGAKLLLVGDHAQLPAIGAGGTFQLLAEHRPDTAQLTGIRRFRNPDGATRTWEAEGSLQIRRGEPVGLAAYQAHDRFTAGTTDEMIHAAHRAWKTDHQAGRSSLLIAADNATVQALNLTVRADRIRDGLVNAAGVPLHDDTIAGVGDQIVTRRVDRHIPDGSDPTATPDGNGRYRAGFVKNGTVFTVAGIRRDGALTVTPAGGGSPVVLPADYVAGNVELGYAVTAHRCQGMTVDATHTIATSHMTREAFYVALIRGRLSNRAYVDTDPACGDTDTLTPKRDLPSARQVLEKVLGNSAAEPSAHELQNRLAPRRRIVRSAVRRSQDRRRDVGISQ